MTSLPPPRLSYQGAGAILLDAAAGRFDEACQQRIWSLAERLKVVPAVFETVPGMNNLMIVFDPLAMEGEEIERQIIKYWSNETIGAIKGPLCDVMVDYGGPDSDLAELAASKSVSIERLVELHSAPVYFVAAVGAMPGFVYLSGLDAALAAPRRTHPRAHVKAGSVIIGGAQAGIMPITAASGWHIVGHTDLALFDPHHIRPALFKAGDRIRFVPRMVTP